MEKLICNAPWGKAKTSRLARVVTLALVGAAGTTLSAHARQIVIPTLPMSPFADTEVSTNVVIHESRTDMRDVKIRLQLDGTPTNNLEIAFGCDENTNGVLDVSEIETVYGWRAGRYFIENVRAWERIETPAATTALCGVIDIQLQNDKHFVLRSFAATCGGEPAFVSLSTTPPPAWLFRNGWNMARVVRRGAGTPSEWVRCNIKHNSFALKVR
ncbi:MAG: hypothetical protein IJQ00_03910 [Kiritimatiellae bacterium]|nr:hypothetical protein [Kiritimatiellia bacterium]